MKQLILKLKTKHLIALALSFCLSILIWFAGPALTIGDYAPLLQPEKRFYIIAFMLLAGILIWIVKNPGKKNSVTVPNTSEALNQFQVLEGRFQGAIQFLKKTAITKQEKNISLANLPWYLVIGPSGSGKTTLLANANIKFILTKQFKNEKITPSNSCDWWATRDLVLVDIPGSYLTDRDKFLWDNFLNLITQNRRSSLLNAVVVTIPFPELLKHPQQKKKVLTEIKQKLAHLHQQFGEKLNIYFAVTKCDLIPGFLEFFSENSTEELAQAWGITLPQRKENETLLDIFSQRFNALIKRLNNQLIWRLHQERNPNLRPAIKDFPLQMERLKETIGQFIKALAMPNLPLQGIYLTSATQSLTEDTSQAQVINPSTNQALQLLRYPVMPIKSYFIRQMILQGLLSNSEQTLETPKIKTWQRRTIYSASIAAIITVTVLLGYDFQQSILNTYSLQNNLLQYQLVIQQSTQKGDHLLKALPLLDASRTAASQTNTNLIRLTNLVTFYSGKSQKTAAVVYQQALQTIVMPELKNYFENYLQNSRNKNPELLYSVLKAYLMLGDLKNSQPDYLVNMFNQLSAIKLNNQLSNDLLSHITAVCHQPLYSVQLNSDLIAQVRNQLTHLPSQELSWIILKTMNNNNVYSVIHLGNNQVNSPIFASKQSFIIPNLFTANAFQTVMTSEITAAATETLQGNWVLGNAEVLSNEATINALAQQLRGKYISHYINTWENKIATLKLASATNLTQIDAIIQTLIGNTSPLLQMLQTIKQNTYFDAIANGSPKIEALNSLLTDTSNTQENALYQIFITLRQLHFYLQTITSAEDADNAAFLAAKMRMQNASSDPIVLTRLLAEQSPEPIKTWLNNLATQSWSFILQEAGHYIENAWQVNIVTFYHSQFANRYPLNPLSNQEVDLQQFVNFVGKQGILANFYLQYLKPFVDDSGKQWQWRQIDNQKLPINNIALVQLQQALKMQNMSKFKLFSQGRDSALQHLQLPEQLIG